MEEAQQKPMPTIAIVGAGPSGLAAAHFLAESHRVHLYDARSCVGGVWACHADGQRSDLETGASQQAYPWLETNTPKELFPFPSFPFEDSDWSTPSLSEESTTKTPYVPARVAQRYYSRFAAEKRLNAGPNGRLAGLHLDTQVKHIALGTGERRKRWILTTRHDDDEQRQAFDKIILATGSFQQPNIPRWAQELSLTNVLHSSALGAVANTERLHRAKRIVVVGDGKSALDVVAYASTLCKEGAASTYPKLILLRRDATRVSAWPLPRGRIPAALARMPLLGSGRLSPFSLVDGWSQSRLGRWAIQAYWSLLALASRSAFPRLYPAGEHGANGTSILAGSARVFPAPQNLEGATSKRGTLLVVHGQIQETELVHHKSGLVRLLLAQGHDYEGDAIEIGQDDVIVLCTGYRSPASSFEHLFEDRDLVKRLGLPVHDLDTAPPDAWPTVLEEAFQSILAHDPLLRGLHAASEMTFPATFRLYRHVVPCEHTVLPVDERTFAVMGLPQTLSASVVAEMQARWLVAYFTPRETLNHRLVLPSSLSASVHETARLVAASIARYGRQDCRQGTAMALDLQWYADLLSSDLQGGHCPRRAALALLASSDWSS